MSQQRQLSHTILLHPSYFGAQLEDYLQQKLYEDVEGTCSGKYGYVDWRWHVLTARYIISVVTINDIGEGKVMPSTGQARFKCLYTAIVMKPFKGEVVDGKVTQVNKMGFFAMVGPLQVFVSSHVSTIPPLFRDEQNA